MELNDLSTLMKMERLELCWLMQDTPSFFKPGITEHWSACVASLEKRKGHSGRAFAWGYGGTPEEAVLAAIDDFKNPPLMNWQKPKVRGLDISLDDLEIEL